MILGVEVGEADRNEAFWLQASGLLDFADRLFLMGAYGQDDVVIVKAADMIGGYVREGVEDMDERTYARRADERIAWSSDVRRRGQQHLRLDSGKFVERRGLVLVEQVRMHVLAVDQERGVVQVERVVGEVDLARNKLFDRIPERSPVVLPLAEDGDVGVGVPFRLYFLGRWLAHKAVEE